ncbi:SDR family NAD(P)-dependent oxidoreductase [Tatumella citrea]|uniref:2-deoxy-D-gluconate 3-dehydrogenase n=1 Tax=Tatumella citrea TaxID=53336 RepID=A0A1Y0LKA4_TATCI|nr:SDR family oxidoreductase [Tatumella citrea]ARU94012.1 2-deoxy-D-gluconate 3-dehydrogenase [Tatumella citrea]ARU98050.1 2-deoxy-D-gluconate 3-dehydrogenase [Tatumella citrea]
MNKMNAFSLSGQRALITGATRGIGLAIATGLAEAGAELVISGRHQQSVDQAVDQLRSQGYQADGIILDVTDIPAIETAIAAAGVIDILINNAGTEQVCASENVTEQLWDTIVGTNLKGAFFCAQAVAKSMLAAGRSGSIINICSLTSLVGVAGAAAYGSSKSGLAGLTRALSTEWAGRGIRVNGIGPGYFETELTEVFYRDTQWRETMQQKIPQQRFGELEDLKGAAVFLSSAAARYITGQILYVDGGYLAAL